MAILHDAPVANPGGGGLGDLCPPPTFIFFLQKHNEFYQTSTKFVFDLETQIFENVWGSMPPDLLRRLAPSALVVPPPPPPLKVLDPPLFSPLTVTVAFLPIVRFYLPNGLTLDHQDNLWIIDVAMHQMS